MSFTRHFPSFILVFLVFLLQFVYFPIGFSHFETPKVYAAEIAIFLLLLVWIFNSNISIPKLSVILAAVQNLLRSKHYTFAGWRRDSGHIRIRSVREPASRQARMTVCFILLFAITIIHLLFFQTEITFFGNQFRLQGVFLLWLLMLFGLLSTKIKLPNLHAGFLFAVIFLQFVMSLFIEGTNNRAVGTLGEPNALAAVMVGLWPFLFFSNRDNNAVIARIRQPADRNDRIIVFGVILTFITILLTASRSGMIAFVLQAIFLALILKFRFPMKKAVVGCLLLLSFSLTLPFLEQQGIYEKRSEVWQTAALAGLQSPVFGHGFGNTEYALKASSMKLKNNLEGSYVDSSHNIFLDWWVQGGIIGLGSFVFLIVQAFRGFIATQHIRNSILLLGLVTAVSLNPASIVSLVVLWWLIGASVQPE